MFGIDDAILVPALTSGIGSIVGGLFGSSSQSSANKANIQMQRETNAFNRQMFDDQLQYNWDMWRETNEYNSPFNQRKLLEEAGYNPALLVGDSFNSSPLSAPTGHAAQVGNAVNPVSSLGQNISNAVGNAAQTAMMLSQAQNQKADTALKNVDVVTRAAENKERLNQLKEGAYAQKLDNIVKDLTLDSQVGAVRQNLDLLSAQTKNVIADTAVKNATYDLEQQKIKLTLEQIREVQQAVLNAVEEGKNLITQRDLLKAGIREADSRVVLNAVNAQMAKIVGESQAAANYASAEQSRFSGQLILSQKEQQDLQNKLTAKYGKSKALAELVKLASESKLNDQQANKAAIELLKINREYRFMPIDRIADMLKGLSGAGLLLLLL